MSVYDSFQTEETGEFDVVIIGSGVAGLVIANDLNGSHLRVAIVEAGGRSKTKRSQRHFEGEVSAGPTHAALDNYRVRAVGGTSLIWGGRVIAFDPIDFERREWVDGSGWPLAYTDLAPFYARALLEADASNDGEVPGDEQDEGIVSGLDTDLVTTTLERFSLPTNFWKKYRKTIEASTNVSLFLDLVVSKIVTNEDGGRATGIEVVRPDGSKASIRGKTIVLAAGGLENPRLLLASSAEGLGNAHGVVGRYYMSHLRSTSGTIQFRSNEPARQNYFQKFGVYHRRRIWINETAQARHHLLNTTFQPQIGLPSDPAHRNAILSAMFLFKRMVLSEYSRKFSEGSVSALDYVRHVGNVAGSPLALLTFSRDWLGRRVFAERKLPSVAIDNPGNAYHLEFHSEQVPNPSSRVHLIPERDRFGIPKLKAEWRLTEQDVASVEKCYTLLGDELRRTGAAQTSFDIDDVRRRAADVAMVGGHHIGTTRMSSDPRAGVVGGNLAVHGIPNLFVVGASVFPTSGQANPTLTIMALALRLSGALLGASRTDHQGAGRETAAGAP